MLLSKNEMVAWVIAIIGICVMGFLAFHGPFNAVIKAQIDKNTSLQVKIVDNPRTVGAYQPAQATVRVGEKVTFTNVSSVAHTATDSLDRFDSGNIATGGSWTWIPKHAGRYTIDCSYHPLMHAYITVQG